MVDHPTTPSKPSSRECHKCGSRRVHPVKVEFWPFQEGPTYWRCDDCFEIWTVREDTEEPT